MKREVVAGKVRRAPSEHLVVDVDAVVMPREVPVVEEEVAKRERESSAATAQVEDVGVKTDESAFQSVEPECDRKRPELGGVEQDPVADPHADAEVVGRQVSELAVGEAEDPVEEVQREHERTHARQGRDGGNEPADGLVGERHGKG